MKQVMLQDTEQFCLIATNRDQQTYQISVYVPKQIAPDEGFPVLYLLDGNAVFGTAVEAVRIQSQRTEKTNVQPAIVVGIGYEIADAFSSRRFYDYTMDPPEIDISSRWKKHPPPQHGGADHFLAFIEEDLKPFLFRRYNINQQRQTIFGHSLGGLFVLHTLFTKNHAFQNYIAGSPSIHWNKTRLSKEKKAFLKNDQQRSLSLLIAVGELEANHSTNMSENARQLAEELSKVPLLEVQFEELEEENHISVLPVLLNKAIKLGLKAK